MLSALPAFVVVGSLYGVSEGWASIRRLVRRSPFSFRLFEITKSLGSNEWEKNGPRNIWMFSGNGLRWQGLSTTSLMIVPLNGRGGGDRIHAFGEI